VNNENLEKGAPHRFKTGQSGNPGGRPKRRPVSDRYAEMAELPLPEEERIKYGLPEGASYGDALVARTFKDALEGNPYAAREIREAIEGKTGQRQEIIDLQVHHLEVSYAEPSLPRAPLAAVDASSDSSDSSKKIA
jgi:hypothetical protein